MNRTELEKYISETYNVDPEFPWIKYPNYEVFRHSNNKKWFAAIMDIQKKKLGLQEDGVIDIANFKCDPIIIGSLLSVNGFFPAYHMNKENWITVALDGSVTDDKIKMLVDMSFELTAIKIKKVKSHKTDEF